MRPDGRGERMAVAEPSRQHSVVAGVAAAAALVALVTVVARVVGFGRWLVFSHTVGATCLGTSYSTANMLPNVAFEVVAGGALASAVVPLVAGQLGRGDAEAVRHTVSALLSWALLVLAPLAVVGALAAGPLMRLAVGSPEGCVADDVAATAARMFVLLAPQVLLYGAAVVCAGVLNAHGRYLAAALAPLLSSVVVVATYLAFGARDVASRDDLAEVSRGDELLLAGGTTAGVVLLAATTLVPVMRMRLGLRPTLTFPGGEASRARALAAAGLAGLVAQQVAVLTVVLLANRAGGAGALNVYNFAWAVYVLPYAVLAVPLATTAFTALSRQSGAGDVAGFAGTAASTTRGVVLVSLLGAGVLVGTASPVARTFLAGDPEAPPPWQLAWALVAFAPGLVGYGLLAHLGRSLYARGRGREAAVASMAGWLLAASGAVVVAGAVGPGWTVTAVGAANSAGMAVAAALLLRAVRAQQQGGAALAGLPRAALAGGVAAAAAAAAAAGLAALAPAGGPVLSGVVAAAAAIAGTLVFGGVLLVADPRDARALAALAPLRALPARMRPRRG